MQTYRQIREHVEDWVEVDNAPNIIRRTVNQVLRQITQRRRFDALQESKTITPEAGVIVAPPLCRMITRIVATAETPTTQAFHPARQALHLQGPTLVFDRFYSIGASTDWEVRGAAFTFNTANRDTILTTATLADTAVGKLLRLDGVDEFFEVVSVVSGTSVTVRPEYTGTRTSGTFSIGNFGLPQYRIDDSVGTSFTSPVQVEYQRYHPALLADTDVLLIPVPTSLALMTVNRLLHYAKYSVDATRLREEILEAEAAEMPQEVVNRHVSASKPSAFAGQGRTRWQRG